MEKSELLNGVTDAVDTNNTPSSIEEGVRETIEGTPFIMVKGKKEWFLSMGNYKLSAEMFKTDLEYLVENRDWELMCNVISVIVEEIVKLKLKEK